MSFECRRFLVWNKDSPLPENYSRGCCHAEHSVWSFHFGEGCGNGQPVEPWGCFLKRVGGISECCISIRGSAGSGGGDADKEMAFSFRRMGAVQRSPPAPPMPMRTCSKGILCYQPLWFGQTLQPRPSFFSVIQWIVSNRGVGGGSNWYDYQNDCFWVN